MTDKWVIGALLQGFFAVFLSLQMNSASARTVVGEWWGNDCGDVQCAVTRACQSFTGNLVANPQTYRNIVCPSNSAAKEIDRVDQYTVSGVETEPYNRYRALIEFTFEERVGDEWRSRQSGPFQTLGVELIECDCKENFIGGHPVSGQAQFCVDLEEGRYEDYQYPNGVVSSDIYAYLPNNHGERCSAIDQDKGGKNDGSRCGVGNPCDPSTGNKFQSETDIQGALGLTRFYNSRNLVDLGLSKGWRHQYQKRLDVLVNQLTLLSSAGKGEPWRKASGAWVGDADSDSSLIETESGFTVTKPNGSKEYYSQLGRLLSEQDSQGKTTLYSYNDNNQLETVTGHYGQSLTFTYNSDQHLQTVTDTLGYETTYVYNESNNLVGVIYPDATPNDSSDNPTRTYHYENSNYPNHLTGITDENGARYARWAYNDDGKAILTKHAETTTTGVGQETFELDYQEEATQ